MYANQTDITKQLFDEIENNKLEYQSFDFKSMYRNTLIVDSTTEGFCYDCYYLVVVEAAKSTDSSIVLMGQNAKLTLNSDKILFDEIRDRDTQTLVNFYEVSEG